MQMQKDELPETAIWTSKNGITPTPSLFNPLLCCLIFPICEMETIPLSFVLLCPEELEWARPFKRTLKTDYCFSLLCATLPTMKRYLRIKVQFCFARKVMLTFHQKHFTALIVRWKSAVFDRAISNLCQCYVVLHHQPGPGVFYFYPYFLWGIMCCDFDLGHFLSSGGLSSSCFSASSEYRSQPKKYDFLLLKWVRPFWFFNHKQWSSEKNPEEYGLGSLCGFWCETGLSNAFSSSSVVKETSKVS